MRLSGLPQRGWWWVHLPLLAALLYTPLAFGGTTPHSVLIADALLGLGFLVAFVSWLTTRRIPRIPTTCIVVLSLLTVYGLLHWINPSSRYLPVTSQFQTLPGSISWLPATVDQAATGSVIRHLGALLLAFIVLLDRCAHSRDRWLLLRGIAISGSLVALIGILQKAGGADAMLWTTPERSGNLFFGAFRYHANATSFLLLSWPAALAVWLKTDSSKPCSLLASLDLAVLFFLVAALFVNTSKAGHFLGAISIALALIRFRHRILSATASSRPVLIILGLLSLLLLAVMVAPAFFLSEGRWSEFFSHAGSLHGRLAVYRACFGALDESGLFGTGPGTFLLVFPYYSLDFKEQITKTYTHAHQDYLEALIEWGWLGFSGWLVLVGGGIITALRKCAKDRRSAHQEIATSVALLALLLVLVHAFFDFPLQIPAIQLPFMVFLAIAWAPRRYEKARARRARH